MPSSPPPATPPSTPPHNSPTPKAATAVFLAAGGTGGHIFPAVATGEALAAQSVTAILVTDPRMQEMKRAMPAIADGRVKMALLPIHSPSGRWTNRLRFALTAPISIAKAIGLIRQHRPIAVAGFGGYPSFPTLLAAILTRTPIILHEQNALLGKANRLFAPFCQTLALTFAKTKAIPAKAATKTRHVGTPVRTEIQALHHRPYHLPTADEPFHLMVIGGSLGATILGKTVPAALALLPEPIRRRLHVTQQCRKDQVAEATAAYQQAGIQADVAPFFDDIPARLAMAHLMISRAGASSINEWLVAGVPAILVPYPHATGQHQHANAANAVDAGAAIMIEDHTLTPDSLSDIIKQWMKSADQLPRMAQSAYQAAQQAALPDAAHQLADLLLAQGRTKG